MAKHILITGSTDGIGKLGAMKLARDGHVIYLHGRNRDKLDAVKEEIRKNSGNEEVFGFHGDFESTNEVIKMASVIQENVPKIDVLINNAGVYQSAKQQNAQGMDLRMAVNYLATVVLTTELMALFKKSDKPRIINVSSAAQAQVSLGVLRGNQKVSDQNAYAQSKLALIMWSMHLAKSHPDLSVIALNPGSLLNTKMVREAFGRHWSSAEKGGDILYDLSVLDEYEGISGEYFDNDLGSKKGRFGKAHPDAYNDSAIQKLVDTTYTIIGQ